MEKIMSKTNETSKLRTPDLGGDATSTVRELRDDELENVTGGGGKLHLDDVSMGFSIDIGTSENLVVRRP
jgi:hypothetical protein